MSDLDDAIVEAVQSPLHEFVAAGMWEGRDPDGRIVTSTSHLPGDFRLLWEEKESADFIKARAAHDLSLELVKDDRCRKMAEEVAGEYRSVLKKMKLIGDHVHEVADSLVGQDVGPVSVARLDDASATVEARFVLDGVVTGRCKRNELTGHMETVEELSRKVGDDEGAKEYIRKTGLETVAINGHLVMTREQLQAAGVTYMDDAEPPIINVTAGMTTSGHYYYYAVGRKSDGTGVVFSPVRLMTGSNKIMGAIAQAAEEHDLRGDSRSQTFKEFNTFFTTVLERGSFGTEGQDIIDAGTDEEAARLVLESAVSMIHRRWATSSSYPHSVAMMRAVARLFPDAADAPKYVEPGKRTRSKDIIDFRGHEHEAERLRAFDFLFDAVAKAEYAETQRKLAELEVTSLPLYRSMHSKSEETGEALLPTDLGNVTLKAGYARPMSSWTAQPEVVRLGFGNLLYQASVPAERIFSFWDNGYGCAGEHEFIVIGVKGEDDVRVWDKGIIKGKIVSKRSLVFDETHSSS